MWAYWNQKNVVEMRHSSTAGDVRRWAVRGLIDGLMADRVDGNYQTRKLNGEEKKTRRRTDGSIPQARHLETNTLRL